MRFIILASLISTASFSLEYRGFAPEPLYDGVMDSPVETYNSQNARPEFSTSLNRLEMADNFKINSKRFCSYEDKKIDLVAPTMKILGMACFDLYDYDYYREIHNYADLKKCKTQNGRYEAFSYLNRGMDSADDAQVACIRSQVVELQEAFKNTNVVELIRKTQVNKVKLVLNVLDEDLLDVYKDVTYGFTILKDFTINPAMLNGRCSVVSSAQIVEELNAYRPEIEAIYTNYEGISSISNGMENIAKALNPHSKGMCGEIDDSELAPEDGEFTNVEAGWDPIESYEGSSVYEN